MSETVVCEVGPAVVRRLCRGARESICPADPGWATAALDGGDDPTTLFGERPVSVETAWRRTLEPLLVGANAALLIHPSWWPAPRIGVVSGAAGQFVDRVVVRPRAWLLTQAARDSPVVEIAPRFVIVTIGEGAPLCAESRAVAPDEVAAAVARVILRAAPSAPVWIDGPAEVPGARALAVLIGAHLRPAGYPVRVVDESRIVSTAAGLTAAQDSSAQPRPDRRAPRLVAAGGVVLAAALIAGAWPDRPPALPGTTLVEGRLAVQIPPDWVVQRITAGPGSARVRVSSPTDGQAALHITQSSVPADDLSAAATTLRHAFDTEGPGLFVDFDPADLRVGRPAVTYREVRGDHDIRWTVLLDGAMRISIGCQSARGREQTVTAACEQAIGSAHEIR